MFGFHPVNLVLRFLLEMGALVAMGVGAFNITSGPFGWAAAIGIPLVAVTVWGVFNVPGDRSRSGRAPVPVPGAIRLAIEVAFFVSAVGLLWPVSVLGASVLAVLTLAHYAISGDRVGWLLAN